MNPMMRAVLLAVLLGLAGVARGEVAYFVLGSPVSQAQGGAPPQAYIVPVSDAAKIAQARAYLGATMHPTYLYAKVHIAAGADGINRNAAQPGQPAWDWHVTDLIDWGVLDPKLIRPAVYIIQSDGNPSDAPSILTGAGLVHGIDANGAPTTSGITDQMGLIRYQLLMETAPEKSAVVLNVSTRGYVGSGDRVMIAGFVISGAAPRNVLVRALGPSLATFGVSGPLADPVLHVYRGGDLLVANDDWKTGNLGREIPAPAGTTAPYYAAFAPSNDKEPALRLMLTPGAYTLMVSSSTGDGIALAEVYDLDALTPPSAGL